MPKMDPSLVDLVLAVRTGIGQDARTHACQWGLLDGDADFAKLGSNWAAAGQQLLCPQICMGIPHTKTKHQKNAIMYRLKLYLQCATSLL